MGAALSDRYYIPLPVWTGGNAYFNGAKPCDKEKDYFEDTEHEVKIDLRFEGNEWEIESDLFDYLPESCNMISTKTLGMAFEPEQKFENPDGSEIFFDVDFFGNRCQSKVIAGPFTK